jgi:dienelactone hydrolase
MNRSKHVLTAAIAVMLLSACRDATPEPVRATSSLREELSLEAKDARLRAVLHLPSSRGSYPAVVLIHGSGRLTADDMAGLVPALTGMGVAVLAYDKRGVGRSTGQYSNVGTSNSVAMFDLLSDDALAAVAALKSRRDIDSTRIGLVGFSQGGWIAPLAASRSLDVAFVISLSGPAVTVGEEIAYSDLAGADPGSRQGLTDAQIDREFAAFTGPHGYDPNGAIRSMRVPSLWILGERDRSLPVRQTLENLERIRRDTRAPITTSIMPGADHSLRSPATGTRAGVWRVVRGWLARQRIVNSTVGSG